MIIVLILLLIGVSLSAFFSGNETGFYRVSHLRLTIDSMRGNQNARWLLWLAQNPSRFVSTSLIGNNLANYLTSLAIVLGARTVSGADSTIVEVLGTIAISPIVFVYGELLPKYLYFQAPNRLLRLGGPLFLFFALCAAPLALVVGGLGRILERVLGGSDDASWYSVARRELQKIFQEGEDAGVLQPAQRELAYNLVSIANQPVSRFTVPMTKFPSVEQGSRTSDALRTARRNRLVMLTVREPRQRVPVGYVSVIELHLRDEEHIEHMRPLINVRANDSIGATLLRMQEAKEPLARVVDESDEMIGLVSSKQLIEPLLSGELVTLRR